MNPIHQSAVVVGTDEPVLLIAVHPNRQGDANVPVQPAALVVKAASFEEAEAIFGEAQSPLSRFSVLRLYKKR